MNSIKLSISIKEAAESEILMALLADFEPNGFEEMDKTLLAYFDEATFDEALVNERLSAYTFTKEIIEQQNWNAQWESNFEPIRINEQVGVRAHFHPAFENCKYNIEITPKMSFGTGHHETTHSMLEFIDEMDFTNKSVFDFGCGTGVLAILAKMKGANRVLGIDNDPWSVENAIENCERNACSSIDIKIDDLQDINEGFDVILANINLNVLIATMEKLKSLLKTNGDLFLSGILDSDMEAISSCLSSNEFSIIFKKQRKQWVALHVK